MDEIQTLKLLSGNMDLEPSEECRGSSPIKLDMREIVTYPAALPNGQQIVLLKTLLSSSCENDCIYCPFRAGRDFRRATFSPDQFAALFMKLYQAGIAQGLFLSSGIIRGGVITQDQLIKTSEILRFRYHFTGYLHLKIMPGAEMAQIDRVMQLADRISINLEAPTESRLKVLAPHRNYLKELVNPLKYIHQKRLNQTPNQGWKGKWASSTTQFVVGAVGDTDLELLQTTAYLIEHAGLRRAYYSKFTPHRDTPLENHPPTSLIRQNRLYQASYLLRDYGFGLEELPFNLDGSLPEHVDPKLAWARQMLADRLYDINSASFEELIRIPGIGSQSARKIIEIRQIHPVRDIAILHKLGISVHRCLPFILLNGRKIPFQPSLI
jgi:predicted DNA-binding helix-hairpin-helix protein